MLQFLPHASSIHWPANSYGFELALRTSYTLFPFNLVESLGSDTSASLPWFMPLRDVIHKMVFMELERKIEPG